MERDVHSRPHTSAAQFAESVLTSQSKSTFSLFLFAFILTVAVFFTLYVTREISMPMAVALLLYLLLRPIIGFLSRLRIPAALSAGVLVLSSLSLFAVGVYFLADPAAEWLSKLPDALEKLQKEVRAPLNDLKETGGAVETLITPVLTGGDTGNSDNNALFNNVLRSVAVGFAGALTDFGWSVAIIFALLFFLLLAGDVLLLNFISLLRSAEDQETARSIAGRVQRDVSSYLLTVTLINSVLGICIGVGMYFAGLPNAALWGTLAAFLNFIPYLGAIIGALLVTIAAFLTFDSPLEIITPALIYVMINGIEGQLITPWVLGRRLSINPVVVFLSVVFWGWLWGTVGVLLAVPLLVCVKVVCDGVRPLQPLGNVLGGSARQT